MAIVNPGKLVLAAVLSRVSHVTGGINPTWTANAPAFGLPTSYINFDFTSTSNNFWFAQIDPEMLEQSGNFKYPFGCLYVKETAQTGTQKFNMFSGIVRVVLEIHMSQVRIDGKINFEAYANCMEGVLIDVFNRITNQDWGKPLVYNGGIRVRREGLRFTAQNWSQRVGCALDFEVHSE